jgi:hypothetical protein
MVYSHTCIRSDFISCIECKAARKKFVLSASIIFAVLHSWETKEKNLCAGYSKQFIVCVWGWGGGQYFSDCCEMSFFIYVETVDDYYEYCHYVAGLVGYGLSRLFYAAGTEDLAPDSLSNSMGLFLQVC